MRPYKYVSSLNKSARSSLPPELTDHPLFKGPGTVAIFTAQEPKFPVSTHGGNDALEDELKRRGFKYEKIEGHYEAPEKSFMVYDPSLSDTLDWGKRYGQESVIWSRNGHHQFHYTNGDHEGTFHHGTGNHDYWTRQPPGSFWTKFPANAGYVRLGFDFFNYHPRLNNPDVGESEPIPPHPHFYNWHDGHTDHHRELESEMAQREAIGGLPQVKKAEGKFSPEEVTFHEVPHDVFEEAISKHPQQETLETPRVYTPTKKTFLNQSGTAGYAIEGDGYWGSLFSMKPGLGSVAAKDALKNGACYGNCFDDGRLPAFYQKLGGVPIRREPNWTPGGPDVVHFSFGKIAKDETGGMAHPTNTEAAGKGVKTFKEITAPFGTVGNGPTDLNNYDFRGKNADVNKLVADHGYQTYYAGGKYGRPDLANKNYNTKHLMIYDPTPESGGNSHETFEAADSWRKVHELAHALVYPELNKIYGEGRRIGALGKHRNLREALRAVHWEWLAVHKQRELAQKLGVNLTDEQFNKELNTVMGDACHRAITGKFTEPGEEGFVPHSHKVPLETALNMVKDHAQKIGLTGLEDLVSKKSEERVYSLEDVRQAVLAVAKEHLAKHEAALLDLRRRELAKAEKTAKMCKMCKADLCKCGDMVKKAPCAKCGPKCKCPPAKKNDANLSAYNAPSAMSLSEKKDEGKKEKDPLADQGPEKVPATKLIDREGSGGDKLAIKKGEQPEGSEELSKGLLSDIKQSARKHAGTLGLAATLAGTGVVHEGVHNPGRFAPAGKPQTLNVADPELKTKLVPQSQEVPFDRDLNTRFGGVVAADAKIAQARGAEKTRLTNAAIGELQSELAETQRARKAGRVSPAVITDFLPKAVTKAGMPYGSKDKKKTEIAKAGMEGKPPAAPKPPKSTSGEMKAPAATATPAAPAGISQPMGIGKVAGVAPASAQPPKTSAPKTPKSA